MKSFLTLFFILFCLSPIKESKAALLSFSSYLGGSHTDEGWAITSDDNGNIYVVGTTYSVDFPLTNHFQEDAGTFDVFIAHITEEGGGSLVFSTYLGGSGADFAKDIVLDSNGNISIVGYTESSDFPLVNEIQTYQGSVDAFISKINSSGLLEFSSYLGSSEIDYGWSIAADPSANLYVAGATNGSSFPVVNPVDSFEGTAFEVFISKISSTNTLAFSTVLGGTGNDYGTGIAVDGNQTIYVTGSTNSTNFPLVNFIQADQTSTDAFIAQISSGSVHAPSLDFSTYLGGNANDYGTSIKADDSGNIWISGSTASNTTFPTAHAYQNTLQGSLDAFVTQLDSDKNLVFSTYLGGTNYDWASDLDIDSEGRAFITGFTESSNFPELDSLFSDQPERDVYLTAFGASGSLIFSTYLGGSSVEQGNGIKAGENGNCYITGLTASLDFPTTSWPLLTALDTTGDNAGDAFFIKLNIGGNEFCDGLDNDEDGLVDEGWPDNDGDGIPNCHDPEECDGFDNNGDGQVDEGFSDTDGDNIADCMDEETCDGVDNDGDGLIDEDFSDVDADGIADCVDAEECDAVDNNNNGITDEGCFGIDIQIRNHLVNGATLIYVATPMMHVDYTIENYSPATQAVNVIFILWPFGEVEGILHPTDLDGIFIAGGSSSSGTTYIDTEGYVDPLSLYGLVAVLYNAEDEITETTWITYDLDWFVTIP